MAVRHQLILLAKNLIPTAVVKQVIDVAKFFRNTHLPKAWLEEWPKIKQVIEKHHVYFDVEQRVSLWLNIFVTSCSTNVEEAIRCMRSGINCRHSQGFGRFDRQFSESKVAKLRMA